MPALAQMIANRFIGQQVNLLRLSASEREKVFTMLGTLQARLLAKMEQQIPLPGFGTFTTQKLNALYRLTDKLIQQQYQQISTAHDTTLVDVSEFQGRQTRKIVNASVGVPLMTVGLPLDSLKALVNDDLVDGRPAAYWWNAQDLTLRQEYRDVIRQGVFAGDTLGQMKQRVQGTKARNYQDGIMARVGKRAETLIRTSVLSVANAARYETLKANDDVLDGQQWLSTLDDRTCWSTDTLILMADGTEKTAGDVVVGDYVTGGVSGLPCKVLQAAKRTVVSSVLIHYNNKTIGRVTHDHKVLTPAGWQEIGSVCLLSDISQREVLCRRILPTATQKPRSRTAQGGGWQRLAKVWCAKVQDTSLYSFACGSLYLGKDVYHTIQNCLSSWLQYDGWWGGSSWTLQGIASASRESILEEISRRRSISRKDARSRKEVWPERRSNATQALCLTGRTGNTEEAPQLNVVSQHYSSEQKTEVLSDSTQTFCQHQGPLGDRSIQKQSECKARGCPSGLASQQSRLGRSESGKGILCYESEMAGVGLSCEDGEETASHSLIRGEIGRAAAMGTITDTGEASRDRGTNEIAMDQVEGVTRACISGEEQAGDVVVVTLSIEGDHTYVAGGIIVHNCEICAALDGQSWDFSGNPLEETTQDFMGPPPAHFSCRCTLVPVLKSWAQMQQDAGEDDSLGKKLDNIEDEVDPGTRASMGGPVRGDLQYEDWLRDQDEETQQDILGPARWDLWQDGLINVQDLVDQQNRPLTLDQIRARAADVFGEPLERPSAAFGKANPDGLNTQEQYQLSDGTFTADRAALHEAIHDELLAAVHPVASPKAFLLGGGPATGKSTFRKSGAMGVPENSITIDSDVIKAKLPEYRERLARNDSTAAGFVHEESSTLAKQLLRDATDGNYNVVFDGTGDGSIDNLSQQVSIMRSQGAKVEAHYLTIPTELAIQRSDARAAKTGRAVPHAFIKNTHAAVSLVFPEAVKRGLFDTFYLWDSTSVQPVLIAKGAGKNIIVRDEVKWKAFLRKAG